MKAINKSKFMKQLLAVSLSVGCLLAGCGSTAMPRETSSPSASPAELRAAAPEYGMWWSYLDYERDCKDISLETFNSVVDTALDNMQSIGVNRVFVHAVAYTDAFYNSSIYPKSSYLGNCDYDPLAVFVKKAHARGMYIDAWINPMRSVPVDQVDSLPEDSTIRQWISENNERIRQVGDLYYLNPAYEDCRNLICSVIDEILNSYDVDGIHMDDYFYPSGVEKKFDAYAYSLSLRENSGLTLDDFRRNNVNALVKQIYDTIKKHGPSLMYSISPSGNIDNNHQLMYAWPEDWVADRTVDELIPQIYWGFNHPVKPFESTLQEWKNIVGDSGIRLSAGLAAYKVGSVDAGAGDASSEWVDNSDVLGRQVQYALSQNCVGAAFYNYGTLFVPSDEIKENVDNEIVHIKSVTLAS